MANQSPHPPMGNPPLVPHFRKFRHKQRAQYASEATTAASDAQDLESVSSFESSSEDEDLPQSLIAVAAALEGSCYLPISLIEGVTFASAITRANEATGEDPNEILATILVCTLESRPAVKRYMERVPRNQGPIIMLCADDGMPLDPLEVQDAHAQFLCLGAADVVWQQNTKNLKLDLDIKVQSALHAIRVKQRAVDKSLWNQQNEILWPFVHHFMEGFPRLEVNAPSNFTSGVQVQSRVLSSQLDKGSFGTIFKCKDIATGDIEVVKVLPKKIVRDMSSVEKWWKEITLLQKLDHPHVVKIKAAMQTVGHVLIFMDFAGALNLYCCIEKAGRLIASEQAIPAYRQIIAGVAHCHQMGVAHRDLKPENIVVMDCGARSPKLKLVDFGLAVNRMEAHKEFVGTVPFIAPELAFGSADEQYDPACTDMWSCGVVLLEILCGVGKIKRMFRSTCLASLARSSKSAYGSRLVSFFSNPHMFTSSVEADIGPVGGLSFPMDAHASLLGLLTPECSTRWDSLKAEACFAEEHSISNSAEACSLTLASN